jgi:hypothetical protein
MNKRERFTMSMECLLMSKRVTKIWASMEIKAVFLTFPDLVISGVDRETTRMDSRAFSGISKSFSVDRKRSQIDLAEEKILFFIWS